MSFIKGIGKFLRKYYYFKLCYNRAGSLISVPKSILMDYAMLTIWLKVYDVDTFVAVSIFVVLTIFLTFFGHYEIKYELAHIEADVNNQINPWNKKIMKKK